MLARLITSADHSNLASDVWGWLVRYYSPLPASARLLGFPLCSFSLLFVTVRPGWCQGWCQPPFNIMPPSTSSTLPACMPYSQYRLCCRRILLDARAPSQGGNNVADQEQFVILRSGIEVWNRWRQEHPDVRPDLQGAQLSGVDLHRARLNGADLRAAHLNGADLRRANLREADLLGARLYEADLTMADLTGAYLNGADLRQANLSGADLTVADLLS